MMADNKIADANGVEAKPTPEKACDPLKIASTIIVVLVVGSFFYFIIFHTKATMEVIADYIEWIEGNLALGILTYFSIYVVLIVFLFPGSILTLAGTYAFTMCLGFWKGYFLSLALDLLAGTIGGFLAFLVARSLFKGFLRKYINKYKVLMAVDLGLQHNGLRMVTLLRACPVVPYNVFNYFMAVTSVSKRDFLLGSWGMVITQAPHVYFCSQIKNIQEIVEGTYDLGTGQTVLMIVGVVMAIAIIIVVGIISRREFKRINA